MIYVASSWRNERQPTVVRALRELGYEVYDFREPAPDESGFHWSDIDPNWQRWRPQEFREALKHPIARRGFELDYGAMESSSACVLVLPCGRSAHLEAGWFVGMGYPLFILLDSGEGEPELMYAMADVLATTLTQLLVEIGDRVVKCSSVESLRD